jgi:hypothetical protein
LHIRLLANLTRKRRYLAGVAESPKDCIRIRVLRDNPFYPARRALRRHNYSRIHRGHQVCIGQALGLYCVFRSCRKLVDPQSTITLRTHD